MKYNEENIKKLAKAIIDAWDMKGLESFAISQLEEIYRKDKQSFTEDCKAL